jgi:hypothetical protein
MVNPGHGAGWPDAMSFEQKLVLGSDDMSSRPEDTEDGQAEVHGTKLSSRGARVGGGEPE